MYTDILDLELTRYTPHAVAEHDLSFAATPFGARRPIAVDPSSEACTNMARSWLARCSSHENCPSQVAAPLPTRLVEISHEGQECKLHISTSGEKDHYVTLSHCWGPDGIKFLLKKANIKQLQNSIHTESLPRSFQDAIAITRRLGFRFLWIDALCIIQDSVEDWACESSVMSEIYRNGIVMISATAAPDSQHGILRPRDLLRSPRFGRHEEFFFQASCDGRYSNKPLHYRGWCLQERIMAPRILHFGEFQLEWECVSQCWAENSGFADRKRSKQDEVLRSRSSSMPFIWPPKLGLEKDSKQAGRLAAFYECIREYTKRQLSKRSDKLAAFSGLVSAFHTPELGIYLAGLWEKDFIYGLNWRPSDEWNELPAEELPAGDEYIAPSWSWASMRDHCEIPDTRHYVSGTPHLEAQYEKFNSTWSPRLLSHHIELATSDRHGRISAASITLRGYTQSSLLWLDPPETVEARWVILDRKCGPGSPTGWYLWMYGLRNEYWNRDFEAQDAPSESDRNKAWRLVALAVGMERPLFDKDPNMDVSVLLLEPVQGLEDTYRRVGIGCLIETLEMHQDKWEQKSLTLI